MPIGSIGFSEAIQSMLGMSWPCALLLVCLILLIIDMFYFSGDGLTYLVHVLLTVIVLHYLPITNWLYLTLIGLFVYGGILSLHLFCWRTMISRFVNQVLAPDRIKIGNEALIGYRGAIRYMDNRWVIHIGEEWMACQAVSPIDAIGDDSKRYGVVVGISANEVLLISPEKHDGV